jgi:hypothetical protein
MNKEMTVVRRCFALPAIGTLLFLAGCERTSPPKDLTSVSIALSRVCGMGSCWSYRVVIHGSGAVDYDGFNRVPVIGHRTATIPQEKVLALLEEADRMKFMTVKDRDFSLIDATSMVITVSVDGKTMKMKDVSSDGTPHSSAEVVRRMNTPARTELNLLKFADDIDTFSGADRWTKCSPACTAFLYHHGDPAKLLAENREPILLNSIRQSEPLVLGGYSIGPEVLIEAGVNVNLADAKGTTPLMAAAKRGDANLVRDLLAHGALASTKDKNGRTAFDQTEVPAIRNILASPRTS